MPQTDAYFLILVVVVFTVFGLALAYGSWVAPGDKK
jgi:hypothetical protein